MNIEQIKSAIEKPATRFLTGGFKPSGFIEESWIGRVTVFQRDEEIPVDFLGNQMFPLVQLFLPNLPFVPESVSTTKIIAVFLSDELPDPFEPMGEKWLLREYKDLANVDFRNVLASAIKPFPLAELVEQDYPDWEDPTLDKEIALEISRLEKKGVIESYYDIVSHSAEHKVGGYPSFCQGGVSFGSDFEFVFQISSDEKANFSVVDGGSLMFAKNTNTLEWKIYYDFY